MKLLAVLAVAWIALWFAVAIVSGFGDAMGWWEYAEVCTPKDALAFCWTGQK